MQNFNIFTSDYWHKNDMSINRLILSDNNDKITLDIDQKFGIKIAQMAGEPIIQYNDVKLKKFNFNNKLADLLYFRNVRTDGNLYKLLKNVGTIIDLKKAPYIDLTNFNNLDDFYKSLSPSTRKSRRRNLKKLSKAYNVEFQILQDNDITLKLVEQVINMKIKQLKQQGKTSRLFMDNKKIQSLKAIISTPNDEFKTIFSLLKCDDKLAAAEIGFLHNNIYYSFLGTMDSHYQSSSIGGCQMLNTIEWAIKNKLEKIDLLPPDDDYKSSWAGDNAVMAADIILPLSLKGKIYGNIYLKTLRPWLKKAYFFVKNKRR